jgi:hypothetical protein
MSTPPTNSGKSFADKPLADAATALLGSIGYKSQKRIALQPNTAENFASTFAKGKDLNPELALYSKPGDCFKIGKGPVARGFGRGTAASGGNIGQNLSVNGYRTIAAFRLAESVSIRVLFRLRWSVVELKPVRRSAECRVRSAKFIALYSKLPHLYGPHPLDFPAWGWGRSTTCRKAGNENFARLFWPSSQAH